MMPNARTPYPDPPPRLPVLVIRQQCRAQLALRGRLRLTPGTLKRLPRAPQGARNDQSPRVHDRLGKPGYPPDDPAGLERPEQGRPARRRQRQALHPEAAAVRHAERAEPAAEDVRERRRARDRRERDRHAAFPPQQRFRRGADPVLRHQPRRKRVRQVRPRHGRSAGDPGRRLLPLDRRQRLPAHGARSA